MPSSAEQGAFEKLNAPLLRHFPELASELGGHLPELLSAAEIAPDEFGDGEGALTYRQAIVLLETAARMTGCSDFGMQLASRQGGGSVFGPLGMVMRHSRSFSEAVTFACEHSQAHSPAARVWMRPVPEEGMTFVGHELLLGNIGAWTQAIEQVLLIGHLQAMEVTGGYARARRIHFRHEAVSSRETYRRHFGCEVRFGEPVDGIMFSAEDLASPILMHSSRIHREMVTYVERTFPSSRLPVHAEVRSLIMRRLASNECSSAEVAQAMDLHDRTLRRRLKQEGSSFQTVKDEVRRALTLYYLERTALDARAISEKLGFAEQSIFSRQCRKWFSKSPRELRKDLLGARG